MSQNEASMAFSMVMAPLIGVSLWNYFYPSNETEETKSKEVEWNLLPLDESSESDLVIDKAIFRNIDVTDPLRKIIRVNPSLL